MFVAISIFAAAVILLLLANISFYAVTVGLAMLIILVGSVISLTAIGAAEYHQETRKRVVTPNRAVPIDSAERVRRTRQEEDKFFYDFYHSDMTDDESDQSPDI